LSGKKSTNRERKRMRNKRIGTTQEQRKERLQERSLGFMMMVREEVEIDRNIMITLKRRRNK
jgi:hypothetical protein